MLVKGDMKHLILDVETKKSFDEVGGYYPDKLGVSFVGAIARESLPTAVGEKVKETEIRVFEEDLPKLFRVMEKADLVVGFNLDGFDMVALKPYYPGDIRVFKTLDLMTRFKEKMGHRISLDAIAAETLGQTKTGDGLDAIKYYAEGELEKLADYCMKDVELTRDIYDIGRIEKRLKFKNKWNEVVEAEIDFEFEAAVEQTMQMSLV